MNNNNDFMVKLIFGGFLGLLLLLGTANAQMLLPTSYDSRAIWKDRCSGFSVIRNQGDCFSCCAMALSSVLSVRECMRDGRDILFSPRQIWDCIGSEASATCANGSSLDQLILNLGIGSRSRKGLIRNSCSPYEPSSSIDDDNNHNNKIADVNASACAPKFNGCSADPDGPSQIEGTVFYEQLIKSEFGNWEASRGLMGEIYFNGPVVSVITMNDQDFANFSKNSYIKNGIVFVPSHITSPKSTSRHCLMVYGWGQDQVTGLNYWLVQNSWGEAWADGGTARILRGMNWLETEWRGVYTTPRPCILGGQQCFNVSSTTTATNNNKQKQFALSLSIKKLNYIHDVREEGGLSNLEIFVITMGGSLCLATLIYLFSPRHLFYLRPPPPTMTTTTRPPPSLLLPYSEYKTRPFFDVY